MEGLKSNLAINIDTAPLLDSINIFKYLLAVNKCPNIILKLWQLNLKLQQWIDYTEEIIVGKRAAFISDSEIILICEQALVLQCDLLSEHLLSKYAFLEQIPDIQELILQRRKPSFSTEPKALKPTISRLFYMPTKLSFFMSATGSTVNIREQVITPLGEEAEWATIFPEEPNLSTNDIDPALTELHGSARIVKKRYSPPKAPLSPQKEIEMQGIIECELFPNNRFDESQEDINSLTEDMEGGILSPLCDFDETTEPLTHGRGFLPSPQPIGAEPFSFFSDYFPIDDNQETCLEKDNQLTW